MDNLKSLIRLNYLSFTKKEKQIADFLLEHMEDARTMSISELAVSCQVADSTISLFAKKIGLSGFKELNVYLNNTNRNILESVAEHDDEETIVNKVYQSNIISLENTFKLLDYKHLNQAMELMSKSNKVIFFALGGSTPIALDAYHKFLRSPINVEFNLDYHIQLLTAGKLNEKSCAFIISHRGNNPDILRIVELLEDNHVPIICLTSFNHTELVKAAKVSLLTPAEELDYRDSGIYTRRISQMVLIDLLFTLLISAHKEETIANLEKMRSALEYTK
ncbi:MAG TPA: MurR/RpiR family transcriptional regulator [Tetragenococcus sp.]|nr:MurR/RpiR family transcriptional regulator [Tetragenococcus sp.]